MAADGTVQQGSVDLTAIHNSAFRDRARDLVEEFGGPPEEFDFWTKFSNPSTEAASPSTLVLGDLTNIVREYLDRDIHTWTASIRRTKPYFLAFMRTERDRRCAPLVDDVLRASDMRLNVCNDASDWQEISDCIESAVLALRPEALLNVTFVPSRDALLLQFMDGLAGLVTWNQLGLADRRRQIVAESATLGIMGHKIEVATVDGDVIEIDPVPARAVLDEDFATDLADVGRMSDESLSRRLRAARAAAGLTQTQLSERTGVDQAVISRIESGQHHPRIGTLRRMAKGLGVTASELLEEGRANAVGGPPLNG